jgi:hypothetical protein
MPPNAAPLPNPANGLASNLPGGGYATFPKLSPLGRIGCWGAGTPKVEELDNAANMVGDWAQPPWLPHNVELIRVKDGAPAAPQQACLTKTPDPSIG